MSNSVSGTTSSNQNQNISSNRGSVTITKSKSNSSSVGAKGQLILECLWFFYKFSKKMNEKFDKFLPQNLKSGQIIK